MVWRIIYISKSIVRYSFLTAIIIQLILVKIRIIGIPLRFPYTVTIYPVIHTAINRFYISITSHDTRMVNKVLFSVFSLNPSRCFHRAIIRITHVIPCGLTCRICSPWLPSRLHPSVLVKLVPFSIYLFPTIISPITACMLIPPLIALL